MTSLDESPATRARGKSSSAAGRPRTVLALSGLLLATFGSTLSGTIVTNALPRIVTDLGGDQRQYTWVITALILAATATGPIWGKLSDRTSKKSLLQLSIAVFVIGSILAGLAPTVDALICCRVIQGVGIGGQISLVQIALAASISPRQRARYIGYFSLVATIASVSGPPVGGLLVDSAALGWRWCFWIAAPPTVSALLLLQKTLHLPAAAGAPGRIDWGGALAIPGGIAVVLLWITFLGKGLQWDSMESAALMTIAIALTAIAVTVERRVADPIVPPQLIHRKAIALGAAGSATIGAVVISSSVFLAQYLQVARGYTPTQSGLLAVPMVIATVAANLLSGRLISRTGRWKRLLMTACLFSIAGLGLLSSIDESTSLILFAGYAALLGAGLGASQGNLVLAAQNNLAYRELGAGTALITFFQTLGGAIGVSVLGTILANQVGDRPGRHAFSAATSRNFLILAFIAVLTLALITFLPATTLRSTISTEESGPADRT